MAGPGEGCGQERRPKSQEHHPCRQGMDKTNGLREGCECHCGHEMWTWMSEGQPEMCSKQKVACSGGQERNLFLGKPSGGVGLSTAEVFSFSRVKDVGLRATGQHRSVEGAQEADLCEV